MTNSARFGRQTKYDKIKKPHTTNTRADEMLRRYNFIYLGTNNTRTNEMLKRRNSSIYLGTNPIAILLNCGKNNKSVVLIGYERRINA